MANRLICLLVFIIIGAQSQPAGSAEGAEAENLETYRQWIAEMKQSERGPFSRLRWFCKDGTVFPPSPYACADHDGGYQHGELNQHAQDLRSQGYYIANILAGLDADAFLASPEFRQRYVQLLIERFLVGADDGWIFRQALFYRGAIQEEDERAGGRALLLAMVGDEYWLTAGFPALRSGARLLPHGTNSASIQKVRQLSATLSDTDSGFRPIRAKIHGTPGAEDAQTVREYAAALDPEARQSYLELAEAIDAIYQAQPIAETLEEMASRYTAAEWLQMLLRESGQALAAAATPQQRFSLTAGLLADLRDALPRIRAASVRLEVLDLGLRVEADNYRAASELRPSIDSMTRHERVGLLNSAGLAAYGCGLINKRLLAAMQDTLAILDGATVPLDRYQQDLNYLGRATGWGTQALRMFFYDSMEKLGQIEPAATLFIQDQLRGSPLLFYSSVLDGLSRDANRLAGVRHRLFGEDVGVGFNALNPGLARGVLHVEPSLENLESFSPDGIYVLPETVSDLPPVAGILTAGEGNPLSHVQLLARNLGIPNVTVDAAVLPRLVSHDGEEIVVAVSKSGLVEISAWGAEWKEVFDAGGDVQGVVIRPDLDKLDLTVQNVLLLDDLRAEDSGRTVGPKAAKLGELRHHYPNSVARGVAIPFGVFRREVFERPHPEGGTVFDWMVAQYRALEAMDPNDPQRAVQTEQLRAELYDIVINTRLSPALQAELKQALAEAFGDSVVPGLFVRSDTNVEDLAGFTGAGLNLTLPNVVGFDALLQSIPRVWASPFTARAFAWRQSHMESPEHVYTSILLLESVPSEKSGVMVTQDIDTGDRDVISVAVNEGVGGAVDGQAAESLRIALDGSLVRVLATATAPEMRQPDPSGGLQHLPSSGSDTTLSTGEIEQLIEFAVDLPATFPPIVDDEGNPAPADVEFGFVGGELQLFQLRPFLESKSARGIGYLQQMEARLGDSADSLVDMNAVPES